MSSIRTKLAVGILTLFFVSLSLLGAINYWNARNVIAGDITGEMQSKADNSADDVSAWLEVRKAELSIIAANPALQNGNKGDIAVFLGNIVKVNKAYNIIGYLDLNGDSVNTMGTSVNLRERDYFKQAVQGKTVVADPQVPKSGGAPGVIVAMPVKSGDRITGVIYGAANMGSLTEQVLANKVGKSGYAMLIQNDGLLIIHPDPAVAMHMNPLQNEKTSSERKAAIQRVLKGEKGQVLLHESGGDNYFAFSPVAGTNWGLAATVPAEEVTGALSGLARSAMLTIVIVLLVAAGVINWFSRRIAHPIQTLEEAVNRVADGDLSITQINVQSNDEIGRLGQSFDKMTDNLRHLIKNIFTATEQVTASSEALTVSSEQAAQASNQIAGSITEVAAGASEQLAAANLTTSIIEQMSAKLQQVVGNINEVAAQSAQATEKAGAGEETVKKAMAQMSQIEETVMTSSQVVEELGGRSREIGQIVDTIASIAGQTNLLALNAAIEAARAGEQGKGFAVVAEEVRKLAEQSQEAAKQIASLIGTIQTDTDRAVSAMSNGTREVKTGTEAVDAAGAVFKDITDVVTRVSTQVGEFATIIEQIAAGSQQVVEAAQKIDTLSKKSTGEAQQVSAAAEEQLASMEEISSSSQGLTELAQQLQTAASGFRLK